MKFIGIELRNYRSIGDKPVSLTPLKKCNILIGQNNAGKSNVLKALKKVSDIYQQGGNKHGLDELELHKRSTASQFTYKLWYEAENSIQADVALSKCARTSTFWFEIVWSYSQTPTVIDHSFAHVKDFDQSGDLLDLLANKHWTGRVNEEEIREEFLKLGGNIFARLSLQLPPVYIIPEFRQIRPGDEYAFDGTQLDRLLANYHMPVIGKDDDQLKFDRIQEFTRRLLHLPNATLEVSRENPTIIIKNEGLRLPITSFGTGVHELLILVTAVLSLENAICCIEEPEIHLYPRLQRELIEFLINDTNNQYLLSTHSPTFINAISTSNDIQVFHLRLEDGETVGTPVLQKSMGLTILRELGIKASDLLQANCIIWIEGLSDRTYLQRWIELVSPELVEGRDYIFMCYRQLPRLNFEAEGITGELVNVLQINQNPILIMDSDLDSSAGNLDPVKNDMIQKCTACGGIGWVTDGREIENYIPPAVVMRACKDLRGVDIDITLKPYDKFSDVVDRALKKVNAKPLNYASDKLNYSRKFAEHFTLADVDNGLRKRLDEILNHIRSLSS